MKGSESGRERARRSRSQAAPARCASVAHGVNHTTSMPAKIGPERDGALAWTGCYFDGAATTCDANATVMWARGEANVSCDIRRRSLRAIASAAKQSIFPRALKHGLL